MRRVVGCLALMIAGCGTNAPPLASAPVPSVPTFDLLAWEYPGARPIARIDPALIASDKLGREEIATLPRESTRIQAPALYAYDSPDPLEAIHAFYGRKLDVDPEYQPAKLGFEEFDWNPNKKFAYAGQASYPTLRLTYTGLEGRDAVVRTATLVGPGGPGFTVVVHLSRAKPEGYTTIELVVTRGP